MSPGPSGPLDVRRLGLVEYGVALTLQRQLVARRRAGEIGDTLLLLEHPHVITMGSSTDPAHILIGGAERERLGIALYEAGRGGDVTYHGPGQLIAYPILRLEPERRDLHRYLRDLEDVLIRTVAAFGVEAERSDDGTGIWTGREKLAAIGVRVSSGWITSHGFALNVATDLSFFSTIVPCGIADRPVTSLDRVSGRAVTVEDVVPHVVEAFGDVFGGSPGRDVPVA